MPCWADLLTAFFQPQISDHKALIDQVVQSIGRLCPARQCSNLKSSLLTKIDYIQFWYKKLVLGKKNIALVKFICGGYIEFWCVGYIEFWCVGYIKFQSAGYIEFRSLGYIEIRWIYLMMVTSNSMLVTSNLIKLFGYKNDFYWAHWIKTLSDAEA